MVFYSHAIEKDDGTKKGTKFLKDHLSEVGNAIERLISQKSLSNPLLIPQVGYLLGIAHDFGKYTSFFQDYLLHDKKDNQLRHHHGFISAVFAAYLINKLHESNKISDKYLPLFAYFVVLHHHGDLNALELDIVKTKDLKEKDFISAPEPWRGKLKALQKQLEDIHNSLSLIEKEYEELLRQVSVKDLTIKDFLNSWFDILSLLHKLQYHLINNESEETRVNYFVTILLLYSLLIDADKKDAADIGVIKRREIPGDLVDRYREIAPHIDTKATTGITGIRNEIYTNVVKKASEVNLSNHIFTLTAPTGTGKTLASFSCALKLRERLREKKGFMPRIIYSLPFTSIIDQNYEVIKEVMSQLTDFRKNENACLIKHHHLEDLRYKIGDEERPISESLLLIESWESEIIVTTFIQLLHTIIGFKNRFLKKYHNIAGSIILLDEVQNIPIEYWPLINKIFKLLVEHLDCYVILLTATKPLIFDECEAIPLLDNYEEYFKQKGLDRVSLIPNVKPIRLNDFFLEFKRLFNKSSSHLIMLNTIKSSIEFYKTVKEDAMFKELVEEKYIFYLSANIIPKERAARIVEIKKLLKQEKKIIIVSTQVIEAGVDIDLDVVIRDIGPIDSIIQVAGRCNREMNKNKGKVFVFNLKDDKCSYATYVYGKTHYIVSKEILDIKSIEESQFFGLINNYFNLIAGKKNQDDSKYIWDAIKNFRFHYPDMHSVSDFELIKEKYGYIDVFVEIDEQARGLLAKYIKNVAKEKNFQKRQSNYLSMRKGFKSYIISIPEKLSKGLGQVNEHLLKAPYEQLQAFYDADTGFKRIEDASLVF